MGSKFCRGLCRARAHSVIAALEYFTFNVTGIGGSKVDYRSLSSAGAKFTGSALRAGILLLLRAPELDPRDAEIPANIGSTYMELRLWKDAERAALRALGIDPQNTVAAMSLLLTSLCATGDVDSARRTEASE